ncbi:MAG: NADH-quinone oxidoreductase subunit C [Burkholderiaceae bacterium]|nr:NADH-quinone oxidoreductase subunit C [Burkholderiaceae bacterium]MBP6813996.1 NADH-quinone oxidoreductase subunit C [Burkholderiaceae bacterium]MBP7658714.1 NADH-quinone oxidoreductase subunit C [Burkholderiaceae bacterium]
MTRLETLRNTLDATLGARAAKTVERLGEITIEVAPAELLAVAVLLRDAPGLRFDTLIDVCGLDYLEYGDGAHQGSRFASVVHLLSVECNQRLRVRAFCADDDYPVMPSLTEIWPAANWFERESFDLLGIVYEGHTDLRRILTDYGFVGHPFRKDFPVSGYVEMRYDPEQKRVVYQPVSIEPRENVPRVIREEGYGTGR